MSEYTKDFLAKEELTLKLMRKSIDDKTKSIDWEERLFDTAVKIFASGDIWNNCHMPKLTAIQIAADFINQYKEVYERI